MYRKNKPRLQKKERVQGASDAWILHTSTRSEKKTFPIREKEYKKDPPIIHPPIRPKRSTSKKNPKGRKKKRAHAARTIKGKVGFPGNVFGGGIVIGVQKSGGNGKRGPSPCQLPGNAAARRGASVKGRRGGRRGGAEIRDLRRRHKKESFGRGKSCVPPKKGVRKQLWWEKKATSSHP